MSRDGFLDRWSRRKLEPTTEPLAEEKVNDDNEVPVEDPRSEDQILEDLGLPHPDDLSPGDDIKGFLDPVVPDRLRRLALRQLWRSNPVLANVDGLVEYGEDYTDAATVIENMQTLYQVGKGMWPELREQPEEIDVAADPNGVDTDDTQPTSADVEEGLPDCAPKPDEIVLAEAPASSEFVSNQRSDQDDPDEPLGPARRRMGFTFDGSD